MLPMLTYTTGHALTDKELATAKSLRTAMGDLKTGKITADAFRSLMAASREKHGARHDLVKGSLLR